MRGTLYTQQDLCNAIYAAVASAGEFSITRLEICERIGRKKSPHITAMIEHLNRNGYLNRTATTNARGNLEFRYFVGEKPAESACADWVEQRSERA